MTWIWILTGPDQPSRRRRVQGGGALLPNPHARGSQDGTPLAKHKLPQTTATATSTSTAATTTITATTTATATTAILNKMQY